MKKVFSILPMLALLIAVAGAFAMKPAPKNDQVLTYYFTGASGEEFEPSKYDTNPPSGGCSGSSLTCEFDVPDGYSDITDYLNWLNSQPNKQSLYDAQVISQRN
jgi:hypothetical protein